jgi:hypothetical protein
MAGGPGSGKSWVIGDIFGLPAGSTLTGTGLKVVNPDNAFTTLLKKNGINPKDLAQIQQENPAFYYSVIDTGNPEKPGLREKAVQLNKKARNFYFAGRLGMIVDGTGAFPEYLLKRKGEAEEWGVRYGYDFCKYTVGCSIRKKPYEGSYPSGRKSKGHVGPKPKKFTNV